MDGTLTRLFNRSSRRPRRLVRDRREDPRQRPGVGVRMPYTRLLTGQGQRYSADGRNAEAVAALVEAHRRFEAPNDRPRMATALAALSWIYHREQDNPQSLQRAIDAGEAALALLDPPRQRHLADTVHFNLAGAYFASGRLPQASEHLARSREFADAINDAVEGVFECLRRESARPGRAGAIRRRGIPARSPWSTGLVPGRCLRAAEGRTTRGDRPRHAARRPAELQHGCRFPRDRRNDRAGHSSRRRGLVSSKGERTGSIDRRFASPSLSGRPERSVTRRSWAAPSLGRGDIRPTVVSRRSFA